MGNRHVRCCLDWTVAVRWCYTWWCCPHCQDPCRWANWLWLGSPLLPVPKYEINQWLTCFTKKLMILSDWSRSFMKIKRIVGRTKCMYIYIYDLYFNYCLSSHQKSKWFWYTREQPWWFIIVWHHSNVKHLISQDIRRATSIRYLKWMDINSFIMTSCNITKKVPTTDQSSPLGECREWKATQAGMGNEINQNRRRDTRKAWELNNLDCSDGVLQKQFKTQKKNDQITAVVLASGLLGWVVHDQLYYLFGDQISVSYQNSGSVQNCISELLRR